MIKLEDRIVELEKLVEQLQEQLTSLTLSIPREILIPPPGKEPLKNPFISPAPYIPPPNRCTLCQMEIATTTGYVCSNLSCPCGLGPTTC